MWNPNPNYYDPVFKRNPVAFNLRPRHPSFPSHGPRAMLPPRFNPMLSQRVPYMSANKRALANLPASVGNYPGASNPQFATKIDRRNEVNLNSPVFLGHGSNPAYSTQVVENKTESNGIPFLSDCDSSVDPVPRSKFSNERNAVVTSNCDTAVVNSSSWREQVTTTCIKGMPSSSSLYDDVPSPDMTESATEPDKSNQETVVTSTHTDQKPQPSASLDDKILNPATSEEQPASSAEVLPFNITKVLGDAKMLNDILSVAKTIQFSEQSKSLNFPTCSSKSVAIVQPINVHTDSTSNLTSGTEPHCKTPESATVPPLLLPPPPPLRSWADVSHSNKDSLNYSAPQVIPSVPLPPKPDVPCSDVEASNSSDISLHSEPYALPPNTSSLTALTEDSTQQTPLNRPLKRPASETDAPEQQCKVAKTELSSGNDDLHAKSTDSSQLSELSHTEPMSKDDMRSALFTELAKFTITNSEEAETVLQVISLLSEAYLKHKLRFMPEAKFQNLVDAIRDGKEKETNFVLGFLKCGSGSCEETPLLPKDDVKPPPPMDEVKPPPPNDEVNPPPPRDEVNPPPPKDEVKPPPPHPVEPEGTVLAAKVSSSGSVPRLEPFVPMYTSGNIRMPVNYWMTAPPTTVATTSYPPLRPPLPPPLLAQMQPPLPPLPPRSTLAPPPLPFADVPLPPSRPPK